MHLVRSSTNDWSGVCMHDPGNPELGAGSRSPVVQQDATTTELSFFASAQASGSRLPWLGCEAECFRFVPEKEAFAG